MAGPAPWVTRPVARLRGAAPRRRGAGRDHHVPTLRAPYVHQPRAAARARGGGAAAGDGGHAEPPARLAPDRAQAALVDRERGGGEVWDRRVEHLHRADPHPDRGVGAAREPVAAGELRRVAAGAPARRHAGGPVAGGAPRRDDGPVQEVREGAAGAETGGAGVRAPGAWGYDRGSGGYAGPVGL